MMGAIVGDVIGSVYENENVKTTEFPLFSRFSRFTVAIIKAYYKVIPAQMFDKTNLILDFGLQRVIQTFNERYKWN